MKPELLRSSIKTTHGLIIFFGLTVGLLYLLTWSGHAIPQLIQGVSFPLLSLTAAYLAFQELWQQRQSLARLSACKKHRSLGHALILFGVTLFPFCLDKVWSQAIAWFLILVGIALSTWGAEFFKQYSSSVLLILLSAHPGLMILLGHIWRAATPEGVLDRLTAAITAISLRCLGQPAVAQGRFIELPTGGVEVLWGCNGFDLAVTIAFAGLLTGIFFKQSWKQTLVLVIVGTLLGFLLNVPRIALLTIASAYWGDSAFSFWHDGLGGQIFSLLLFGIYYYISTTVMSWRLFKRI